MYNLGKKNKSGNKGYNNNDNNDNYDNNDNNDNDIEYQSPPTAAGGKRHKKYNGRSYIVRTGTRGGKYILVKGKKIYV